MLGKALGLLRFQDPDITYRYMIEIDGIFEARFQEVSGLKSSTKVTSVREGGNNRHEMTMIDGNTYEDVVLKKGFFAEGSILYKWLLEVHHADAVKSKEYVRRTMSIVMMNSQFIERGRFNLFGVIPVEYEAPSLNATSKEIAVESIKLHYDYFDYEPASLGKAALGAVVGML